MQNSMQAIMKNSIYAVNNTSTRKPRKRKATQRKRNGLSNKVMFKVAKQELGYASENGESIYSLLARVLRNRGHEGMIGQSDKSFVKEHAETIKRIASETPSIAHNKNPKLLPQEASKDFLFSYEWRKLRMVALKKYGAMCQCCGATPSDGIKINVDHIKPRKHYPELALDINNLQILCDECNHGKGNWDETDWRKAV